MLLSLEAAWAADPIGVCAGVMETVAVLSPAVARRDLLRAAGQAGALLGRGRRIAAAMVDQALEQLNERSLLCFGLDGQAVAVHCLVARVVRGALARRGRLAAACGAAASALEIYAETILNPRDRVAVRELLGQVTALLENADAHPDDADLARMLLRLRSVALHHQIELGDSMPHAIAIGEELIADLERVLGPDHPDRLSAQDSLAGAYQAAGRAADAIPLLEHILVAQQRVLGPKHPDTLNSQSNLAGAYRDVGRFAEAILLFKLTLAAREVLLGADDPSTLKSRGNLAAAYRAAGRIAEAIPLFEQTLDGRELVLGAGQPDVDAAPGNLTADEPKPVRPDPTAEEPKTIRLDLAAEKTVRLDLAALGLKTDWVDKTPPPAPPAADAPPDPVPEPPAAPTDEEPPQAAPAAETVDDPAPAPEPEPEPGTPEEVSEPEPLPAAVTEAPPAEKPPAEEPPAEEPLPAAPAAETADGLASEPVLTPEPEPEPGTPEGVSEPGPRAAAVAEAPTAEEPPAAPPAEEPLPAAPAAETADGLASEPAPTPEPEPEPGTPEGVSEPGPPAAAVAEAPPAEEPSAAPPPEKPSADPVAGPHTVLLAEPPAPSRDRPARRWWGVRRRVAAQPKTDSIDETSRPAPPTADAAPDPVPEPPPAPPLSAPVAETIDAPAFESATVSKPELESESPEGLSELASPPAEKRPSATVHEGLPEPAASVAEMDDDASPEPAPAPEPGPESGIPEGVSESEPPAAGVAEAPPVEEPPAAPSAEEPPPAPASETADDPAPGPACFQAGARAGSSGRPIRAGPAARGRSACGGRLRRAAPGVSCGNGR